ncbi:hypothetical protein QKW60_09560 [Defluviimonas aestuarii]|uniref:hypothetical protein n=1 Tax=Albidovulum aestuarii TaxID=1130726 RepID=UPI00249AE62E|nr:hypothetical protein [Defluviimonas aestuarii]MDI3336653.1 hypothetical protein [Defluviimonas aestuarii]
MAEIETEDDPVGYNDQIRALERERTQSLVGIMAGLLALWFFKSATFPEASMTIIILLALGIFIVFSEVRSARIEAIIDRARRDGVRIKRA